MTAAIDPVWAVVPAAGAGRRFGAAIPKQYLNLAGETVLELSVDKLLRCGFVQAVVVVVSADDNRWRDLPVLADRRVQTVVGGQERADSVQAGLLALEDRADPRDWVLVHDAVRPCVAIAAIEQMVATLAEHPVGGIMAVPVSDTLKRADADQNIVQTVDRDALWAAQTPQMFRYGLLQTALQAALDQGLSITDEASAMELAGHQPALFNGDYSNIKITHPADLKLAHYILEALADG